MNEPTRNGHRMNFFDKCHVLGEMYLYYRQDAKENEVWSAFFDYNDVSLPLAYGIDMGLVQVDEDVNPMETYIDETWDMFCDLINIDSLGEYANIGEAWDASPNAPLDRQEADPSS